MFEKEVLPYALSIGISETDFWGMNPHRLKIHAEAYQMKMKRLDELAWSFCGNYILSAVAVAVEHCLAGKKAKSKYINEPLTRKELENRPLTEEEIQAKRDAFVKKMELMKINFDKGKELKENG